MVAAPALAIFYPALFTALSSQPHYAIFPDENGTPYIIDTDETPLTLTDIQSINANLHTVNFKLFTRDNPMNGDVLKLGDVQSITTSHWNPKNPTRFVTHGWRSDGNGPSCRDIRNAYLEVGDYNVIIIDWSAIAGSVIYGNVAKSVPLVAAHVASLINFMKKTANLDTSTTKIIGHSLGAHLAGLAARDVSGRIAEVVALDPARPHFQNRGPGQRVDATDATHVQVIHTNGGKLGLEEAIGTSDFYPNEGRKQPGCSADLLGACAHSRSYQYYAESIKNPKGFQGITMAKVALFYNSRVKAYMGGPTLDQNARGPYTLTTSSSPPFALGG